VSGTTEAKEVLYLMALLHEQGGCRDQREHTPSRTAHILRDTR
jgi:hypothetical protein